MRKKFQSPGDEQSTSGFEFTFNAHSNWNSLCTEYNEQHNFEPLSVEGIRLFFSTIINIVIQEKRKKVRDRENLRGIQRASDCLLDSNRCLVCISLDRGRRTA